MQGMLQIQDYFKFEVWKGWKEFDLIQKISI